MIVKKTIADPHVARYLEFLEAATSLSREGSIERQFSQEAQIRYQQYQRRGCPAMRYSCWSAIQIALRALEKQGAPR
jgi:hypothetical protein